LKLQAILTAVLEWGGAFSAAGPVAAVAGSGAGSSAAVGGPIHWASCEPRGPRLQCARIHAPLDCNHPNGRTIQLALIRHLAGKPKQRIGSLLINPGGPGDTGVGLVRLWAPRSTSETADASTSSAGIPATPT
jgi:hypothetical protein